jgi:hypothetical protein
MSKTTESSLKFEAPAASLVSGAGALVLPVLVREGQPLTKAERVVGEKLRTDLVRETAIAIKGEQGARLTQTVTMRAVQRFSDYVDFEREIRDKPRGNAQDQADVAAFCQVMRQAHGNSQLAIRHTVVERIEEIVSAPLDPPAEAQEEVIVEHKPGLLGWIFGGQQVTRVKR